MVGHAHLSKYLHSILEGGACDCFKFGGYTAVGKLPEVGANLCLNLVSLFLHQFKVHMSLRCLSKIR